MAPGGSGTAPWKVSGSNGDSEARIEDADNFPVFPERVSTLLGAGRLACPCNPQGGLARAKAIRSGQKGKKHRVFRRGEPDPVQKHPKTG